MAYTLPQFNLNADVWYVGYTPNGGGPNNTVFPCQKYLNSRGLLDIQPDSTLFWVPPVWIRFPIAAYSLSVAILELPSGSTKYYAVRFKEKMHEGFSNEYGIFVVHACDGDGNYLTPGP